MIQLTLEKKVLDFLIFVALVPVEDLECDNHVNTFGLS